MSDLKIEVSYFTVRVPRPGTTVHRTVEIRPDLHVDLDSTGRLLGIERIGGVVGIDDLGAVLRRAIIPVTP